MERERTLRQNWKDQRKRFYVNCWHANDDQSDAMWKLYSSGGEGVAIQTTCRQLKASLADTCEELWLYKVMYTRRQNPVHGGSMLRACMTKRLPFEHEKEVRLVCDTETLKSRPREGEYRTGFYVRCDLNELIETLYIAPTESPWFEPIVVVLLEKYGINANVKQSDLKLKPQ